MRDWAINIFSLNNWQQITFLYLDVHDGARILCMKKNLCNILRRMHKKYSKTLISLYPYFVFDWRKLPVVYYTLYKMNFWCLCRRLAQKIYCWWHKTATYHHGHLPLPFPSSLSLLIVASFEALFMAPISSIFVPTLEILSPTLRLSHIYFMLMIDNFSSPSFLKSFSLPSMI